MKELKGLTFEIHRYDLERGTNRVERLAWSAPPGDAEAYCRNFDEDKGDYDSDNTSKRGEITSEVIDEQITPELNNEDGEDENEDIY